MLLTRKIEDKPLLLHLPQPGQQHLPLCLIWCLHHHLLPHWYHHHPQPIERTVICQGLEKPKGLEVKVRMLSF